MAPQTNSQETLHTDSGVNNLPIFAPNVPKEAFWAGLRHLLRECLLKSSVFKELGAVENPVMKYFGFIILN